MTPLAAGFSDELTKVARFSAVREFAHRLEKSHGLRNAIRRSAGLGAVTGGTTAMLSRDKNEPWLRRLLSGAALGALGGGITGGVFPGWFAKSNMRAADEVSARTLRRMHRQ